MGECINLTKYIFVNCSVKNKGHEYRERQTTNDDRIQAILHFKLNTIKTLSASLYCRDLYKLTPYLHCYII